MTPPPVQDPVAATAEHLQKKSNSGVVMMVNMARCMQGAKPLLEGGPMTDLTPEFRVRARIDAASMSVRLTHLAVQGMPRQPSLESNACSQPARFECQGASQYAW